MPAPHLLFSLFNKDDQVDERMEARDEDSSHSESSHPILTSCETADVVVSPDITKMKRQDPEREIVGREGFHKSQLTESGGGEAGEAVGSTISALRDELPPSTSAALDQPEPAEQQGGDRCLTQERQAKKEDGQSRQEKAVPALKIDVEGEDGEEEKLKQKALQVETIASGTEVEQEPLHPKAPAEKSQVLQNLLFLLCLQRTYSTLANTAHVIKKQLSKNIFMCAILKNTYSLIFWLLWLYSLGLTWNLLPWLNVTESTAQTPDFTTHLLAYESQFSWKCCCDSEYFLYER